jgi:peptidoglycan/xylan/chitin deacetylase (PgdA/CDA1 family)
MRIGGQRGEPVPILMYHSIGDKFSKRFAPFVVPPRQFAEQMAYLAAAGYTPLTVQELVNAWAGTHNTLPARPVVLTFDDGFADFRTQALPLLQQYGFAATLFVTTGFVGSTSQWLEREGAGARPLLSWRELSEVSAVGIECGGHTHTHPALDALPDERLRTEITECRDCLQQGLGRVVSSFAYPFGYHSASVQMAVREAGYTSACAVKYTTSRPDSDRYALARLIVTRNTSLQAFIQLLARGGSTPDQLARRIRSAVWVRIRHAYYGVIHTHDAKGIA